MIVTRSTQTQSNAERVMQWRWRSNEPGMGNNCQWRDAHVNRSQPPVCSGVRRAANSEKTK